MQTRIIFTFNFVLIFSFGIFAQTKVEKEAQKENRKPILAEEKFVESKHTIRIDEKEIRYTAMPGQLVLRRENGEARGNMFFVAYSRSDSL